jgi:hypothetical protein
MPISPKLYAARAEEFEHLATLATNPTIKTCYLELAADLRRLAGDPLPEQSDQQVEQLAERMAESSRSKL